MDYRRKAVSRVPALGGKEKPFGNVAVSRITLGVCLFGAFVYLDLVKTGLLNPWWIGDENPTLTQRTKNIPSLHEKQLERLDAAFEPHDIFHHRKSASSETGLSPNHLSMDYHSNPDRKNVLSNTGSGSSGKPLLSKKGEQTQKSSVSFSTSDPDDWPLSFPPPKFPAVNESVKSMKYVPFICRGQDWNILIADIPEMQRWA